MSTPTRSAGNEVNQGMSLIDGLVRGEYRVPPETYTGFDYDLGGGTSDNWDEVANALNVANHSHGWPTSEPWETCLDFAESSLDGRKPFLEKEGSLLSAIYFVHHTWNPRLAQYGCLRYGIGPAGDPRAAAVAEKLRGWLRAGVLWPAICAHDVPARGFTGPQAEWGGVSPTPGSIEASGPPHAWMGGVIAVGACGGRSWAADHRNQDGKFQVKVPWYIAVHGAGALVVEFGLGRAPHRGSNVAAALRDRFGVSVPDLLFDAAEREQIRRLVQDKDVEALRWARREIGPYLPKHPVRLLLFEGGLATVCRRHAKGATSSTAAQVLYPDGRTVTLSADSLLRGTASAYNREQLAEVDVERRTIRAWCEADDNQPFSEASVALPPGRLIWDFEVEFGVGWTERFPVGLFETPPEPEPIPVPDPAPPPKPSRRKVNPAVLIGAAILAVVLLRAFGCF